MRGAMDFSKSIERTLFEAAAGVADPAERAAFLDRTCHEDPELRGRLEKLLELQDRAEEFFDVPPVKIPAGVTRMAILEGEEGAAFSGPLALAGTGACIGRYRLIQRMGEGGCGVVYRAEQLEPVRRHVALKVIRLGMDTENVIARFELERQALAMMDHPNIARVLDAGTTSTGRPFFVMELVDGEKITDFCQSGKLGIRERLDLFVRVCQAIQHAHQKGVIHRDIKPSNVLVSRHDGTPVPKVIDFGIAKATAGDGDATITLRDQFLGTPAYMSPEQAAGGGDVDTRSDIYSLGVLLYELICDRPPFDPQRLKDAGPEETRRILREEEPAPPSAAGGGGKLGDLDWIVMKAMAKERPRRYDTANGLGMDVQRFLDDEPVVARPPSRGYQLAKLVRRNKVLFAGSGVAVLGLVAGLAVSTRMFFLERASREEQTRLRGIAESGFRVSQAAVMISYGNLAEADKLLAEVPVEQTPSSLEAAESFRKVAEWHLAAGRRDEAAERYSAFARAISTVDPSDTDSVSRNLLPAAAILCFTGDTAGYDRLREFTLDRFSKTAHPVVGEQTLKICLLRPANEETLRRLRPLVGIVAAAVDEKDGRVAKNPHLAAWSCFSLALAEYRDGNDVRAAQWASRCIASPQENSSRIASARLVLAMIEQRAGRTGNAKAFLDMTTGPVMEKTGAKLEWGHTDQGNWYDWVNAGILHREALGLIGGHR
jgi:serine/threonine protein kinase